MSITTMRPSVPVDEDGYLIHPEDWNEMIANNLAECDGIAPLTEAHWSVIQSLRQHFYKTGGVPSLRHVCLENDLDPHCIPRLFRDRGHEAWRVAGLPNPGEEARAYF